ncbi:biotin-dependent carboxyltransferase family protein [Amnibacterium flavum]|uniref:Allophanate hydrolase n=1 Tax=Amnibacterium flavum TaxID=2173173 RepID=A0A2V1HRP7_9MICO|nr:biotin-dependent carboxyltransferase family protein [Amnibacterium flavum]PVZ95001.1 allophanate hydrolase [Amnibacterium flavum]
MTTSLTVIEPGALLLIEDLGRAGLEHLGVGASGASDRRALALANRLVGNPEAAAGLELLIGGAQLVFDFPAWIAVTGAWGTVIAGGRSVEPHTATRISAGESVRFGMADRGLRYLVAIRGGVEVPVVLGSRSRDTLAAIGPAPLTAGDVVPVGSEPPSPIPGVDVVPVDPPGDGTISLAVRPGPRADWFGSAARAALVSDEWTVSPRSDRTGLRLEGPALGRVIERELPSEGTVPGAIQVSSDGAPTVLGVDAPVTGGYPVIAVVIGRDLDALAQLRPGQRVRLHYE